MNRKLKIILALFAMVALVIGLNAAASSSPTPITSKYYAPDDTNAFRTGCDTVKVEWDKAAHSDFSVVKYSTNPNFEDSDYFRPQDYSSVEDALDAESVEVSSDDNDRTYYKVAVADYEGHRLSPYSNVNAAQTTTCP